MILSVVDLVLQQSHDLFAYCHVTDIYCCLGNLFQCAKKTFEDGEYLVYCTNGIEIDMNFGLMDSNQFKFTDV